MGSNPGDFDSSTNNWIPADSAGHTSGAVAGQPLPAEGGNNKAVGPSMA